ncbi:MAG: ester cyclase [Actinomycetota bacterium]
MSDPSGTIRTLFDLVAAKDLAGVSELFAVDATFTDAVGPTIVEGRPAITAMVAEMWEGLSDVHVEVRAMVSGDHTVMAEIELVGTHDGPFLGCEPTGRAIRWPGAVRYELSPSGDEIVAESFFYDSVGLMAQLEQG